MPDAETLHPQARSQLEIKARRWFRMTIPFRRKIQPQPHRRVARGLMPNSHEPDCQRQVAPVPQLFTNLRVPFSLLNMTEPINVESSLVRREALLAAREMDLQARRREAAREIRRQRRESNNLDSRLAEIESLMSELAKGVLQSNSVLHEQAIAYSQKQASQEDDAQFAHETQSHQFAKDAEALRVQDALTAEVHSLREQIESLKMQNEQLAGNLAQAAVRRSISNSSGADATMTWEQRKAMLFAQALDPVDIVGPDESPDVELLENSVAKLGHVTRRSASYEICSNSDQATAKKEWPSEPPPSLR